MAFRKLIRYLGQYKKYAIITPITVSLEVVIEMFIPYLMANIIDIGVANKDVDYVIRIGLIMVASSFVSLFLGITSGRFAALAATGMSKNIRHALFGKIQDFSFKNVDHFSTASLITRLTTDINFVQMTFQMVIRMLIRAPLMMLTATILAIKINTELAVIFFIAIPVLGVLFGLIIYLAFPKFQIMLKKYDALNASVQEAMIAIRVIKAFVRHDFEDQKFEASAVDLQNAQRNAEKIVIWNSPIMMTTMNACILAILWFGGVKIIGGSMQPGALISFLTYTNQIVISLMLISMVFVMYVVSQASADRIVEVLEEKLDLSDAAAQADLAVADGSIEFDHVSFSYAGNPDNLTLTDANIQIASGETVGIIGGTGSAKTTFVQLIPRLYDVLLGAVKVGGNDVRDYKFKTLRDSVAMVLQKNVLFSGTIKDNLRWGNQQATDDEIEAACKVAQADEFIRSFPDGYETQLGQGGVNLSGGQKQRLCIARALLKNPRILILDDSTSAVDTATESQFRADFSKKYNDITTLVIAQRITSICEADKIIVLDEGRINGVGTHDELMKDNLIYREMYASQQKGVAA